MQTLASLTFFRRRATACQFFRLDGAGALPYFRPRETPPHRGAPIWKDRSYGEDARSAACCAAFLLRPVREAPRMEPANPHRRSPRTFAPLEIGQSETQTR